LLGLGLGNSNYPNVNLSQEPWALWMDEWFLGFIRPLSTCLVWGWTSVVWWLLISKGTFGSKASVWFKVCSMCTNHLHCLACPNDLHKKHSWIYHFVLILILELLHISLLLVCEVTG
jgi:hypothetical protein